MTEVGRVGWMVLGQGISAAQCTGRMGLPHRGDIMDTARKLRVAVAAHMDQDPLYLCEVPCPCTASKLPSWWTMHFTQVKRAFKEKTWLKQKTTSKLLVWKPSILQLADENQILFRWGQQFHTRSTESWLLLDRKWAWRIKKTRPKREGYR